MPVCTPRLFVPNFFTGRVDSVVPEAYRDALNPSGPNAEPGAPLYVTRRGASRRMLRNDAELADALTGSGFETVVLEELEPHAALAKFACAPVVVGVHGAGLSHLFVGRAALIELHPCPQIWPHYSNLVASSGRRYTAVIGDGANYNDSFTIDVERVRSLAGRLLDDLTAVR
jgi:capsular polysaccharide biosynthesis protein